MSVSVSSTPVITPALAELLNSTVPVQERIKQFSDARDEALKALADLNLGREAAAALVDSKNLRDEAARLHDVAKKAADEALNTLGQASAQANQIIADAHSQASQSQAAIADGAGKHQAWIDSTTAELKAKETTLDEARQAAEAARLDYMAKAQAASAAQQAAHEAEVRAVSRETEAQALKDRLAAAVAQLTTGPATPQAGTVSP